MMVLRSSKMKLALVKQLKLAITVDSVASLAHEHPAMQLVQVGARKAARSCLKGWCPVGAMLKVLEVLEPLETAVAAESSQRRCAWRASCRVVLKDQPLGVHLQPIVLLNGIPLGRQSLAAAHANKVPHAKCSSFEIHKAAYAGREATKILLRCC